MNTSCKLPVYWAGEVGLVVGQALSDTPVVSVNGFVAGLSQPVTFDEVQPARRGSRLGLVCWRANSVSTRTGLGLREVKRFIVYKV